MTNESEKFDTTVRRILSVSHDELVKREQEWKRKRAAKKQERNAHDSRDKNDNSSK